LTVRIAGPLRGAHCSNAHHRVGISAPARRVKPRTGSACHASGPPLHG